jgi:hypothetical protein
MGVINPDVRYASAYLDTKYKKYAEKGELVQDKLTGEIYLKRKADSKIVSFDQNNKYNHDIMIELRIMMQNYIDYEYPTHGNAFFTSVDYKVEDILNNSTRPTNLLETQSISFPGANSVVGDNSRIRFDLSLDTNAFLIRLIPRGTDKHVIEYLSNIYNKAYRGTSIDPVEAARFEDSSWISNNAHILYTVKVTGILEEDPSHDETTENMSGSAIVDTDRESIVFLPTGYDSGFSEIHRVEVFITNIKFTKVQKALEYINRYHVDTTVLDNLTPPDDRVLLDKVNIMSFVDSAAQIPIEKNIEDNGVVTLSSCALISAIDINSVLESIGRIDKLTSGVSMILSVDDPGYIWTNNNTWAEIIRSATSSGVTVETNHPTDINDLERWMYNTNGIPTYFTFEQTDRDGIYINGN